MNLTERKTAMKMKRNNWLRIVALSLAVILLLSLLPTVFAADQDESGTASAVKAGKVIHIESADDLIALSGQCTLDTWSQGKTVELDADLSLDGVDFTPIPTFGGTFHGNGHTISGFQLSGQLSTAGLFRTLQEGGKIADLNVNGTLDMSGTCEAAGGIVGDNYGTIIGCSFSGSISGNLHTGGIVGTNELSGAVQSCQTSGAISGSKMTGGIVGYNLGLVSNCSNGAFVNTSSQDEVVSVEDIPTDFSFDRAKASDTQAPETTTDSGGITGYSAGVLRKCTNTAVVGYPHVGYNVGGIAGRSCGYIYACENSGTVYGRKDVGGIAGQLEPYIEMSLTETRLQTMQRQLEELNELVNQATDDAEGGADGISSRLNNVSGAVSNASNAANNVSVNVGGSVDATGSVSGSGQTDVSGSAPSAELSGSASGSSDTDITVTPPETQVEGEGNSGGSVATTVNPPSVEIEGSGGDANITVTPPSIETVGGSGGDGSVTISGSSGSVDVDSSGDGSGSISAEGSPVDVGSQSSGSGNGAVNATVQIIATPNLGGLTSAINGIGSQISQLNGAISETTGVVADDVRAINAKYNELTSTMFDAIYSVEDDEEATITDASNVDVELITLGKAYQSENHGAVSGDLNVGGVAGSMSEESEIDPEDDVSADISAKYKQEYTLKAVIHDCTNDGTITAKRNYTGSICGKMDLGLITDAKGFGEVSSESGSYVGGIAGLTGATIRNSYAKCTLSGKKYIGGIVGSGIEETINQSVSNVSGCYSMVDISSAQQYFGAVSGANAGEYLENYFVSDALEGIDGQSYSGKAEPISYEALLKVTGLPKEMKTLTLRFTDGAETLKELSFDYGDSFDSNDYPEIPEKDDCYAYWDKTDLSSLHFDTVVTAVYEPYVTTLAVADKRDDDKPIFYVEGDYDGTKQPTVAAQQKSSLDFAPISNGIGKAVKHYLKDNAWYTWLTTPINREVVEQWSVTIPSDGQENHKVHYLSPSETADHLQTFVKQDGKWTKLDSEEFGSYLVFSLPDGESEIAVVSVLNIWWAWAILLALVAALVVCIVFLCRKHAKKRKAKRIQAAQATEGEGSTPQPRKKKRWILPLVIGLVVLAAVVAVVLYFLVGFGNQLSAYQALRSLEDQKALSAELTIDTELDGEALHSQTKLERQTIDGVRFSQIDLEGVPLYYANEQVILENGRAYSLGELFPDYSDLLGLIVPLYQDVEFDESEDTYQVSVAGETAQKILQAVVPDVAEQISETQELTIAVQKEEDAIQKITLSASGALQGDAGSNFSISVCIDSIESTSDLEVPQTVIDAAKEGSSSDTPAITEDLLQLLSAWAKENGKDSASADVALRADCGPVVVRDSLKLYRQTVGEQTIYCVSKGGVNLYWSDDTVVDADGNAVSGDTVANAKTAKLLELAYLICQKGDFTKSQQADDTIYSVLLDADSMSEMAAIIAPDAGKLDPVFQNGTLTVSIRDGEIAGVSISGTGTVTVAAAKVTATIEAAFTMTDETITIPKRVENAV